MRAYFIIILMCFAFPLSCLQEATSYAGETRGSSLAEGAGHSGDLQSIPEPQTGRGKMNSLQQDGLLKPEKKREISRVLAVLGNRIDDRRVLEKVQYKLFNLSPARLEMITSLSDHIGSGHGTENTIAFFLLTTLIIFS